jgi:hypothetical protein
MDIDAPFCTILDVNEAYLSANTNGDELVGKSVFEAFPANTTNKKLI